jgi:uncharacterized membrane protein
MSKNRLEAFSDGVMAVIITIMVLELKVPASGGFADAYRELAPHLLTYVISFVFVAIYWNNHHHLLHAVTRIDGVVLWANMHLLFWLSLVPFTTAWVAARPSSTVATATYGMVFLLSGVAYVLLERALVSRQGRESLLAGAIGRDIKGKLSVVGYVLGIALAFVRPAFADAVYAIVALTWFVPDRRIELFEKRGD